MANPVVEMGFTPMETINRRQKTEIQDAGSSREIVRIVEYIQKIYHQGDEFLDALGVRKEWRRNYRMFRGGTEEYIHAPASTSWRSKVIPPEAFRATWFQVPRVIQGIYPHRQWAGVYSEDGNRQYEKLWSSLLQHHARRGHFIRDSIPAVQMASVLGHMVGKVVYEVEVTDHVRDELQDVVNVVDGSLETVFAQQASQKVRFSGPKFYAINPFKILQDPTGQGLWWIEKIPTTVEALYEVNRNMNERVYINLDQISDHMQFQRTGAGGPKGLGQTNGHRSDYGDDWTIEEIEGSHSNDYDDQLSRNIMLWQCWMWVPPHVVDYGDGGQWRLIVVANGDVVIRDVPIPTHDRRPPYFNVPWIPVFGRLFGVSHLSYAHGMIDEITQIDRARMDELLLSLHPQTILNNDVTWDNRNWHRQLGGIARVRGFGTDKPISNAIARFDTQPSMHNVWQERAAKRATIDELFGATPLFEGMPHSSRQTAQEISTLQQEGGMQHGILGTWFNLTYKSEYLERSMGLTQRYMTEEQVVRVTGEEDQSVIVSAMDLQANVELILDVGLWGPWGQLQAGALTQSMQMAQLPAFESWVKPREFFGDFIEYMGAPNADRYLWTTEEMESRQRELFGQQMAVLQQQGMDQGALPPTG